MRTPVRPGAQKRTRTHRRRVITDTCAEDKKWARTKKGHSPSSHPRHRITVRSSQRSVLLLELFAIVLCRRIHFLSVKTSHYFQVISEPLNFTFRATRITGQLKQDSEIGARDSQNRNRNSTTPLSLNWRGGPGRVHLPSSGHIKESLLGRSASNDRTGGPDNNQLSTLSNNSGLYF